RLLSLALECQCGAIQPTYQSCHRQMDGGCVGAPARRQGAGRSYSQGFGHAQALSAYCLSDRPRCKRDARLAEQRRLWRQVRRKGVFFYPCPREKTVWSREWWCWHPTPLPSFVESSC